jgi:Viral BACON domain
MRTIKIRWMGNRMFMIRRALLLASTLLILSACGGGGGGGGSNNSNTFTVHADRTSVSFEYVQGTTPAAQSVGATWTGVPPAPLYVGAKIVGAGLDNAIPLAIDNESASVTLQPMNGLSAGTYSGQVLFYVCVDSACTQAAGNTPITISYTIKVDAPVFTGPPDVAFLYVRWISSPSADVALNVGAGAGAWTATASDPWISLSQTSGNGAGTVLVNINTLAAPAATGDYNGTVTIIGASGTQSTNVTLTLRVPAMTTNAPIAFAGVNGATQSAQMLVLGMGGVPSDAILAMSATSSAPWLIISNASPGISFTSGGSVTLNVDPSQGMLTSGSYNAVVHLHLGTATDNTDMDVPVTLNLTKATLSLTPASIVLGGTQGRTFTSSPVSLALNTDTHAYNWSAGSAPTWMTLDKGTGSADSTGQSIVITPHRLQSTPGTTTTTVRFSAAVNGDTVTADLPVSFNLDTHRLVASENGVAFVKTPTAAWNGLTRTVTVTDNFALNTAWTASSNQSWLTVTPSGSSGGSLTLTANPAGLTLDQYYAATISINTSDVSVSGPEQIRVGFWVGSTTPAAPVVLGGTAASFDSVVGDPIRPYLYAHEQNATQLRVFNTYTGAELAPIPGVPAQSRDMVASSNGDTLFVSAWLQRQLIPVSLLNHSIGTTMQSPQLYPGLPLDHFRYVRLNGAGVIMSSIGDAFLESNGSVLGSNFLFAHFGTSGNNQLAFSISQLIQLDFTSAGGGTLTNTIIGTIPGFSGEPSAINFDGSAIYGLQMDLGMTANPQDKMLAADGLTMTLSGTVTTGLLLDNVVVTRPGKIFVREQGANGETYFHAYRADFSEVQPRYDYGYMPETYMGAFSASGDGNFGIVVADTPTANVTIVPVAP